MKSYVIIAALSGAIFTQGQQAGGGAAAGGAGAAGGTAAGAGSAVSGTATSAATPGGSLAQSPLTPGSSGPGGIANPTGAGSSSISTPGSASTIGLGAANNQLLSGGRGVPFTALPGAVQGTLRAQAGGSPIGTITQIMTANGPVYTTTVLRNGTPTTIALQPNGTLLNPQNVLPLQQGATVIAPGQAQGAGVNVVAPTAPGTATAAGLAQAQAGLPISALPPAVQAAIRTQQAAGTTVQTVSRDDTPNGPLFRVTVSRNGVPTEMAFAANGVLLGQTALNDSLTSPSGAVVGTVPPAAVVVDGEESASGISAGTQFGRGQSVSTNLNSTNIVVPARPALNTPTNKTSSLKISELPDAVAAVLKEKAPDADIRTINRDETASGEIYRVSFRDKDRFAEMVINGEGRIIRDSRDVPVVVIARERADENSNGRMEFSTLPLAVRNAIKAYADPSEVRSVRLTRNRDGKTVYDVVTYTDGRRNRMEVAKDGTLSRFDENVSVAAEGETDKPPVLALGDLPIEVQDTIRRQTDTVRIQEIGSTTIDGDTVYQVKWETNGAPVELMVASDGALIYPTGTEFSEAAGDKAPTPLPDEDDGEVVKRVDTSAERASIEASGAPAAVSSGISTSTEIETGVIATNDVELKKVPLEDVPQAVQNTVKKLGGSAVVESVAPRVEDSGIVYDVTFLQNGSRKTMRLNKDGSVHTESRK